VASVSLLADFLLEVAEHGGAEESVRAGLVAFALLAKPSNDVRIEAKGWQQLLFLNASNGF
jgi:hypothetical protein